MPSQYNQLQGPSVVSQAQMTASSCQPGNTFSQNQNTVQGNQKQCSVLGNIGVVENLLRIARKCRNSNLESILVVHRNQAFKRSKKEIIKPFKTHIRRSAVLGFHLRILSSKVTIRLRRKPMNKQKRPWKNSRNN